jgi:hypothetical protein
MKRIIRRIETAARLQSAISIIAIVFSSLAVAPAADAEDKGPTIYVDCEPAAPGGDGSKRAPLPTITAALVHARRVLGGAERADINVAAGVCDRETLPIVLDVPVRLTGSEGGGTWVTASNVSANTTFFKIIEDAVEITQLVIDGGLPLGDDIPTIPPSGPFGIDVIDVDDFVLTHLRIQGMGEAVRIAASNGQLWNSDLSARSGVFLSGGDASTRPTVDVRNNRILYRINGIVATGAGDFGTALSAVFKDNEVVTSFTNTGPASPAAFRVSPDVSSAGDGDVEIVASGNFFGGPAKYGIMIHGGPRIVRGNSYTGTVDARFADNIIDGATLHPVLITFTNARATVLPAELNPKFPPPPNQTSHWEYLTNARYTLRHDGELEGALIDHPQFHPVDGYLLGNVLRVNRAPIAHQTFVVVPQ